MSPFLKPVLNTFIECLCSKPGAENAPLMDGLRPAEGRLWVMDGLRAAEGRPKAVSTDGHGNQVFTWIASLKQKSWIWHLWNRGCGLWPCDSRVVNARVWLRMTRVWPASDPSDNEPPNPKFTPYPTRGLQNKMHKKKNGPVKILKSHTKRMTFGFVLMQSHTRFKVSDAKKS